MTTETTIHFYRPGIRTGDALAPCLDCGAATTDAGFAEMHEPSRTRCPAKYPHHAHVWRKGGERSISDAPRCPGIR